MTASRKASATLARSALLGGIGKQGQVLLTQVIAHVLAAAFVTHEHFVAALATPGNACNSAAPPRGILRLFVRKYSARLSRSMIWIFSKVSQPM
jgi:hypothetical protein